LPVLIPKNYFVFYLDFGSGYGKLSSVVRAFAKGTTMTQKHKKPRVDKIMWTAAFTKEENVAALAIMKLMGEKHMAAAMRRAILEWKPTNEKTA
jgi:hypothetical protein